MSLAAALFVAALIAIAKWRNKPLAARFEHALWTCVLVAMLAFAVPRITIHAGPPITLATLPYTGPAATFIAASFDPPAISIPNPRPTSAPIFAWSSIWLPGASLMTLRIFAGLFLTRRSLARARTIRPGVAESDRAVVPMTVGWPHARIILPAAWQTWPTDKLHAVLLHEQAHVRRRDPLITFLAAINKAIFWFHPLAWWLERRLAELAEFAADDAAAEGATIDRQNYAAVLIDFASSARPARLLLHPVSVDFAQHGAERISRRIDRILDTRARSGSMKIVCVTAIAIAALAVIQFQRPLRAQALAPAGNAQASPVLVAQISAPPNPPQSRAAIRPIPAKPLTFDAASIKSLAQREELREAQRYRPSGGPGTSDPGRVRYPAITLQSLVSNAWGVSAVQIEGPDSLETEWFAVDATMPPSTTTAQFRTMLQNLLAERFNLVIHRETKEVSGYSLVLAAKGPKMKEAVGTFAPPDDGAPDPPRELGADGFFILPKRAGSYFQLVGGMGTRAARWTFREMTMAGLANELQPRMKGPVADATGLTAKYDFVLTVSTEGMDLGKGPIPIGPNPNQAEDAPPDLFSALQSQLGLKLEPRKMSEEVIVVDHMEKTPTEN